MISKLMNLATKFGLPILAIGLIAFSVKYLAQAKERMPKVPPPVQPAANPFHNTVAGAGMVEPETENISIGASLPGIVVEVMVKVGQHVKAGDPLFRIDDRDRKAELKVRAGDARRRHGRPRATGSDATPGRAAGRRGEGERNKSRLGQLGTTMVAR